MQYWKSFAAPTEQKVTIVYLEILGESENADILSVRVCRWHIKCRYCSLAVNFIISAAGTRVIFEYVHMVTMK